MMYEGKVIDRRGSVEAKNTVSDYTEIEQVYLRSIYASVLYTEYLDHKLNIIDAPGGDDFVGGVIPALRVANTSIMAKMLAGSITSSDGPRTLGSVAITIRASLTGVAFSAKP